MDLKHPRSKQLFSPSDYRPVNPCIIHFHRPILFIVHLAIVKTFVLWWMRYIGTCVWLLHLLAYTRKKWALQLYYWSWHLTCIYLVMWSPMKWNTVLAGTLLHLMSGEMCCIFRCSVTSNTPFVFELLLIIIKNSQVFFSALFSLNIYFIL